MLSISNGEMAAAREPAAECRHGDQDGLPWLTSERLRRPIWAMAKAIVKGIIPQILKPTQALSEKLRQTISLRAAKQTKKHAHRNVSLPHPAWLSLRKSPIRYWSTGRPRSQATNNMVAKNRFTIVGFILMKMASCSTSVRPPKTTTKKPETSGMIGNRPRTAPATAPAPIVAAPNTPAP